jgi:hypothetical protein
MSSTQAEVAVLRSRIAQLEVHQKMQAALESEKRDRIAEKKDLEQKIELTKMQAALEIERRDRKELEQKIELSKVQAMLENEKRDRQAEMKESKRDQRIYMENEKRDRLLENEKRDRLLENEKRDREAEKKERTMQAQIEQLKWEARFARMEQQVAARPYYSQQPIVSNPAPRNIAAHPTPLLQRVVESKPGENKPNQAAPQEHTAEVLHVGVAMAIQESKATPVPLVSAALPSEPKPQASRRSQPSQLQHQQSESKQSEIIPPPQHQPPACPVLQRQVPTGSTVRGPVQLPGDASNHFFLSHCQATGGDQTNAIYLELRQLGFSCW